MRAKGGHFDQLLWQCSAIWRKVSVFVKCDTIFILVFFLKLPQFHTFNYRNIVWQHTEGVVGSIIWVLLEIYLAFQQWQNCKSPFRIDKVIAISLVYYFFGTQCTQTLILKVKVICLSFSSWNLLNSVCSHWANLLAIRTVSNAYSGKQCSF